MTEDLFETAFFRGPRPLLQTGQFGQIYISRNTGTKSGNVHSSFTDPLHERQQKDLRWIFGSVGDLVFRFLSGRDDGGVHYNVRPTAVQTKVLSTEQEDVGFFPRFFNIFSVYNLL